MNNCPLRGWVTDWFLQQTTPNPLVLTVDVVCPNNERMTVQMSVREHWGVLTA